MSSFPLTILAGKTAAEKLAKHGWAPSIFSTLIGASGGAKMLGLVHLDRFLFGDYLQRSDHPMALYGSSIGSWRNSALAAPSPLRSLTRLQDLYLNQRWAENDPRAAGEIVDELCNGIIEGYCDDKLIGYLCNHARFTTHIVTSRGLGLNNNRRGLALGAGMGLSAIGNMLNRRFLAKGFQRVVFSSGPSGSFQFRDFDTLHIPLSVDNLKPALVASGSIPFLMSGQRNVPGAPHGQYWDGGVIDYHFDLGNYADNGLILYPHFTDRVIKGWFDKMLGWRQDQTSLMDRVVLLAPSESYLRRLPLKKIPDRGDFKKMSQAERIEYWSACADASTALAEGFESVLNESDPLKRVTIVS
ncbi:MAG: hypothetical protein ACJAVI_004431 [Candidatus Azotimanducaceae bacterium]